MASLNRVFLIGNLTRDPDLRYTPRGSAVCEIGLAMNRSYTTEQGEKREETTFVDITFWGKQAELVSQYCTKGRPLFVEGRLQLDTWEDKQTQQKRSKLRVVAETMQFLGARPDGVGGAPPNGEQSSNAPGRVRDDYSRPSESEGRMTEPDDDDIPF
ncbi:MAG: single-stranded DNA-binding protein [Verrucomicrobiales bacterium]